MVVALAHGQGGLCLSHRAEIFGDHYASGITLSERDPCVHAQRKRQEVIDQSKDRK